MPAERESQRFLCIIGDFRAEFEAVRTDVVSFADYCSGQIMVVGRGDFTLQRDAQAIGGFSLADDFVRSINGTDRLPPLRSTPHSLLGSVKTVVLFLQ